MANDRPNSPLALSGIDAGRPQEMEYDAVYAAVSATERGRWFLTEFASRNRHADTGPLIAALARIEAAVAWADAVSNPPVATSNVAEAAEEIADIAFGLRERGADRALCDALDAAVRQISAASGDGANRREDASSATLRDAGEATLADETQPAAADCFGAPADEGHTSPVDGFEFELQDREKFAAAATALAATMSSLGEQSSDEQGFKEQGFKEQGLKETPTEDAAEPLESVPVIPPHDYTVAAAPEPQSEPVVAAPRWHIEAPAFVFQPAARPTNGRAAPSSSNAGELPPRHPAPRRLMNPDDDPAELFEQPSAPAAKPNSAALQIGERAPLPPSSAAPATITKTAALPDPEPPPLRLAPRPAPINPLAALRALSEDELLALFG
ncbi:MAG: hypothetical protein WBD71_06840 [Xanthobacteraceae bacterium]